MRSVVKVVVGNELLTTIIRNIKWYSERQSCAEGDGLCVSGEQRSEQSNTKNGDYIER